MELFTLGADRGAYTETDVREQARALTGWTRRGVNKRMHRALRLQPEPARQPTQDDLRADRQLRLAGLVPTSASTTRCTRRSSSTKLWSYFVPMPPDSATVERRSQALYARPAQGAPGRRGDPAAPGSSTRARAWSSRRSCSTPGLLRMRRPLHRHVGLVDRSAQSAGQQLFYPPDVGGWDYTRWLDTATFRARWFIAALVQGATTPTDTPSDPAQLVDSAIALLGHADDHAADAGAARRLREGAARSGRSTPGDVETALRRLVASSPDLQTA